MHVSRRSEGGHPSAREGLELPSARDRAPETLGRLASCSLQRACVLLGWGKGGGKATPAVSKSRNGVRVYKEGQEVVKPTANSGVCNSSWGQEEALAIVAGWGEDFICVVAAFE